PAFLDVTIGEDLDLPRAEVTRQGPLLAHDHAVTEGAGGKVAGLDEGGNVTVLNGTEADIVHAAAEEIAEGRRHRGGILLEKVGEEIEVVDAIRLRHSHVVARPLEACEASSAVADGAHASALDALAQELRHGMEAEDVP